jgi:hypothetical protein
VPVREALLSGRDIPKDTFASSGSPTDVVHYIAALGLGLEEVGAEAFADAIAASGLFPQLSAQQWRAVMIEAEASGANAEAFAALTRFDLVGLGNTIRMGDLRSSVAAGGKAAM